MHVILEKTRLSDDFCLLKVHAPHVTQAEPGQFVIVQYTALSEPIPLSILETFDDGFTCLIKAEGRSTLEIIEEAQDLYYVAGPLGKPFPVNSYGHVVFYSQSWGIAPILNVAEALKAFGNRLTLYHVSDELPIKEKVYSVFDAVYQGSDIQTFDSQLVVTAGSNQLSKRLTELYPDRPVIAMVNIHMLDAIGLCLVCRVLVEGKYMLACTHGPWFNAHKVDWEILIQREGMYAGQEALSLEEYKKALRRRQLSQS